MPAKHYPLGGSTAHIWTQCPAMPTMVRFAEAVPPGEAADRGTRIHAMAEAILLNRPVDSPDEAEMVVAREYTKAVRSKFGGNYSVEQEFTDGNGYYGTTVDGFSLDPVTNTLWIWDLKTGNEYVSPENNKQLLFCLFVICCELGEKGGIPPTTVNLGIYQDGMFKWWTIDSERAKKECMAFCDAIEATE